MQSLEDDEYSFEKLLLDADPVIPDGKLPVARLFDGADGYFGCNTGPVKFDGIRNEVLEQQFQFGGITAKDGQIFDADACAAFADHVAEIGQYLFEHMIAIDFPGFLFTADPRE